MIHNIANYLDKILEDRLIESSFYGIMVDETTDKSTNTQVIIYIQYLCKDEDGIYKSRLDYLDIVSPKDQSAISIKVFSFV